MTIPPIGILKKSWNIVKKPDHKIKLIKMKFMQENFNKIPLDLRIEKNYLCGGGEIGRRTTLRW